MKTKYWLLTGALLIWALLYCSHAAGPALPYFDRMLEASNRVRHYQQAIWEYREEKGLGLNRDEDINRTGIIGLPCSETTTTSGSIESKRTAANPDFAALLVRYFSDLDLQPGDTVAVGASSSFPGLIMAVLASTEAMDLKPVIISSLGSSTWGANEPDFTWLDMERVLKERGLVDHASVAVFFGGDQDEGLDMTPEGREAIRKAAERNNVPLYSGGGLEENIDLRLEIYNEHLGPEGAAAFVNIGGALSNLGRYPHAVIYSPGLNDNLEVTSTEGIGVMGHMVMEGVPVIHLLNIRQIAVEEGLPLDPYPFPPPGDSMFYGYAHRGLLAGALICGFLVLAGLYVDKRKGKVQCPK